MPFPATNIDQLINLQHQGNHFLMRSSNVASAPERYESVLFDDQLSRASFIKLSLASLEFDA